MRIDDKTRLATLPASYTDTGALTMREANKVAALKAFSQTLNKVQQADAKPQNLQMVDNGDTLIGMVREQAAAQGVTLKPSQEFRLAQRVAQDNGIQNANRIFTGQKINLGSLETELAALKSYALSSTSLNTSPTPTATVLAPPLATATSGTTDTLSSSRANGAHPILEKTLERAVSKGFIPAAEKTAVYDKILNLANTHLFAPDDFARMTLMESDGMNPRASNQRCHGIIQFCDGPDRGAASAGYAANPRAILGLSVHQQLDLVGKYFEEVGLKKQGPAGLEDLYLSVLKPAARNESASNAPLNIPGTQARDLHVGRDTHAPITRQSIRDGLIQNATQRLGQVLAPAMRLQAMRAAKYADNDFK